MISEYFSLKKKSSPFPLKREFLQGFQYFDGNFVTEIKTTEKMSNHYMVILAASFYMAESASGQDEANPAF